MLLLTRLGVHSSYAADVLPSLLIMGLGMGMIFAPSMSNVTLGVASSDSGVASATVNASQQVGGSVGVALLSTFAASAVTSYLAVARPTPALMAQATIHGYTIAFFSPRCGGERSSMRGAQGSPSPISRISRCGARPTFRCCLAAGSSATISPPTTPPTWRLPRRSRSPS